MNKTTNSRFCLYSTFVLLFSENSTKHYYIPYSVSWADRERVGNAPASDLRMKYFFIHRSEAGTNKYHSTINIFITRNNFIIVTTNTYEKRQAYEWKIFIISI